MLVRPVIPVADYIINYDYITKVLCENKAKPVMHCNGKCHLMKELAKTAEQDKPISPKKGSTAEIEILFFQPVPSFTFQPFIVGVITKNSTSYNNLYGYLNTGFIFRPPLVIS
jgi:hypothetical protein